MISCALGLTGGCTSTKYLQTRAEDFNRQAQLLKSKLLLLNIIRAAYGQPMQWSGLTQVTEAANSSGTVGATVPIAGTIGAMGLLYSITGSTTTSETPTYTVPLFDTKEFQSGISTQVTPQILKSLTDQGLPLRFLLSIFVASLEVDKNPWSVRKKLGTSPRDIMNFDQDLLVLNPISTKRPCQDHHHEKADYIEADLCLLGEFTGWIDDLSRNGISLERTDQPVGPILIASDIRSSRNIMELLAGPVELRKFARKSANAIVRLTPDEERYLALKHADDYFRFLKHDVYRFCFKHVGYNYGHDRYVHDIKLPESLQCGSNASGDDDNSYLKINIRSVESTIQLLSRVARLEIDMAQTPPDYPTCPLADSTFPSILDYFKVQKGQPPPNSISVSFENSQYYVKGDGDFGPEEDKSSQVLGLLLELINLYSSAKDLPAPNTVSIIAP